MNLQLHSIKKKGGFSMKHSVADMVSCVFNCKTDVAAKRFSLRQNIHLKVNVFTSLPLISFNNRQITLWANIIEIMNFATSKSKLSLEMEKNFHRRVCIKLFYKKYVDKFIDSYSYRKPLQGLNI